MTEAREHILQTTCSLLESQGYHATGINQIVKESGAPKGSVYYYFPNGKEQIAAEAIAFITRLTVEQIRAGLREKADAAQAVQHLAETIALHIESSQYCSGGPLATVALETASTNERLNQACRESYQCMRAAFEEKLIQNGLFPEQAVGLSMTILAALEGGILLSRTAHSGDPLRQVGKYLARLIQSASEP